MATVQIGCKLPHGLVLEIITVDKTTMFPAPTGPRVTLKGANSRRPEGSTIAQGEHPYAITEVDKGFWDKWIETNANLPYVKNGQVFVADSVGKAAGIAKDQHTLPTGLEALKKESDPRTKGVAADPDALRRAADDLKAA